jgi:hypothetical protein
MKLTNIIKERKPIYVENNGPCWDGYEQIGTKMKGGKEVPNCVPKNEVKEVTHTSQPGEWVGYVMTSKGADKLMGKFKTARGAKLWLSKNNNKLLNTDGVERVGVMGIDNWNKFHAKWAIESVSEYIVKENCGCVKTSNPYSLSEFVIKENDYTFGDIEYTAKNMNPTAIQDLAFAYHQAPIGKLAGRSIDHRIRTARDLGKLIGKNHMNPMERGKEPALLLHLHKNKLVNVGEYKELYNGLFDKLKKISKYVKNADPATRADPSARAAAKADMKEAKKYSIGSGYMGNGLTIWNREEEEFGDYKTIAHISKNGDLKIYDKQLPNDIKKMIQMWADSLKKGNRPELY